MTKTNNKFLICPDWEIEKELVMQFETPEEEEN